MTPGRGGGLQGPLPESGTPSRYGAEKSLGGLFQSSPREGDGKVLFNRLLTCSPKNVSLDVFSFLLPYLCLYHLPCSKEKYYFYHVIQRMVWSWCILWSPSFKGW